MKDSERIFANAARDVREFAEQGRLTGEIAIALLDRVHRYLKAENLLVDEEGDRDAD